MLPDGEMRSNEKLVRQGAAGRREYAGQLQLIGDAGREGATRPRDNPTVGAKVKKSPLWRLF